MPGLIHRLRSITKDTPKEEVRELNKRALVALGWSKKPVGDTGRSTIWGWFKPNGEQADGLPNILENLQDAADMVPEGWRWDLSVELGGTQARLWNGKFAPCGQEFEAIAKTSATALTIAILKAVGKE